MSFPDQDKIQLSVRYFSLRTNRDSSADIPSVRNGTDKIFTGFRLSVNSYGKLDVPIVKYCFQKANEIRSQSTMLLLFVFCVIKHSDIKPGSADIQEKSVIDSSCICCFRSTGKKKLQCFFRFVWNACGFDKITLYSSPYALRGAFAYLRTLPNRMKVSNTGGTAMQEKPIKQNHNLILENRKKPH